MNCPNCGAETHPQALFCPKCRNAIPQAGGTSTPPQSQLPPSPQMRPMPQAMPPSYTSNVASNNGLAIASFVLSLVGIFTCGLFGIGAIISIILGIVGLIQINNSGGRQQGSGFAIAGLCITVLSFVMLPAILFPVFSKARDKATTNICLNNQRKIVVGVISYAQDHNEKLPSSLQDAVNYIGPDPLAFHCPSDSMDKSHWSYGYNSALAGIQLSEIADPQSMLCTADGGNTINLLISTSDIASSRHLHGYVASFMDGSVRSLSTSAPVKLALK